MSLARQVRKYLLSWWWDGLCRAFYAWAQGSAVIADLQDELALSRTAVLNLQRENIDRLAQINDLREQLVSSRGPPLMIRTPLSREQQEIMAGLRPGAIVEMPYREVYTARESRVDNDMINWTHHEPNWIRPSSQRRNPEWHSNQERLLSQRQHPTTFTGPEQEDL